MKSSFEQNGGTYRQVGDFNIPKLDKWGMLHKTYLEKHKKVFFYTLLMQGKLYQHCAEIEKQANKMFDMIVEQMKVIEDVTEELKEGNQMEWVQRMGNIEERAMEIITSETIYT